MYLAVAAVIAHRRWSSAARCWSATAWCSVWPFGRSCTGTRNRRLVASSARRTTATVRPFRAGGRAGRVVERAIGT
jgi:hypothetical protein